MTSQRMALVFLVVCLLVGTMLVDAASTGCWEDWRRCNPGTQRLLNPLENCNDKCKELGHRGGECRGWPIPCCYCY